jgi:methyltransferase (TIGR00027 family)
MNHADTAHWVTVYRAEESKRPDSLFRDPLAARLAGERGNAIVNSLKDAGQSWTFVVRTLLIDRILEAAVWEGEVDCVLDIGAGMDARSYRLRLPQTLRWVEVDLPEVVDGKSAQLADALPHCWSNGTASISTTGMRALRCSTKSVRNAGAVSY